MFDKKIYNVIVQTYVAVCESMEQEHLATLVVMQ